MKNTILRRCLIVVSLLTVALPSVAGDSIVSKIKLAPIGRFLLDGATYFSDNEEFVTGAAIPDATLGVKAQYEDFSAKVEVGVSYGKLSLKDIYLQYEINDRFNIRAGNFVHPFGLQSAYSSSKKTSMEMPVSNSVFDLPRAIGVEGNFHTRDFLLGVSVGVESKANVLSSDALGKTGWGAVGRFVWRNVDGDRIFQIGWSGAWLSPQYNEDETLNHKSVSLTARFPTSVAKVTALDAVVDKASGYFKFTPELLLSYGRVALESQYYHGRVWRDDAPDYTAYGAYATLRGIVLGDNYKYRARSARIDTPSPKSLEVALQYNYTCLSDREAGIWGGRVSDVSCTINWYINRYIIWRLRGGYTHNWDRADGLVTDLGSIQTRIQLIF